MTFDPKKVLPPLPTKHVFSFFDEFRKFAFKGNMIDLAIAVVIGGAFGKVVDSLVRNVIMPLVSYVIGLFGEGTANWESATLPVVPIKYGAFLAELLNFLIVAFSVFLLMVKVLGWLAKLRMKALGEKATEPVEPPPTKDQLLLTEIRDLLKIQQTKPA